MRKTLGSLVLLLLHFSFSEGVFAASFDNADFRISGFGSLMLVNGGDDTLAYRNNILQEPQEGNWQTATDSVLGLQFDAQINQHLSATVQLVSKNRMDDDLIETVEWAFLRYDVDEDNTLRAGRLAIDLFLLSEYKDVGLAYDWVRPPAELYGLFPLFRFEGVDFVHSFKINDTSLDVKVFAGGTSLELGLLDQTVEVDLKYVVGASLTYITEYWQLRAIFADSRFDLLSDQFGVLTSQLSFIPNTDVLVDRLSMHDLEASYSSLGFKYQRNKWTVLSELSLFDSKTDLYLSSRGAYVSVARRIADMSVYAIASTAKTTDDVYQIPIPAGSDVNTVGFLSTVQGFLNGTELDQDSFSLGARWDVHPVVTLKAQWTRSWIHDDKTLLWVRSNNSQIDDTQDVFSLGVSFIF